VRVGATQLGEALLECAELFAQACSEDGWDEHAAFMDRLVDEGFVITGGPAGDREDDPAVLVVEAPDEPSVHARLADDPWPEEMLCTASVRRWHLWL
jgi:hypothetical protein